jgi:hypothetical protein
MPAFNYYYIHSDEILLEKGEHVRHPMNYINYEGKVVERLGVALVGWPWITNPNKVGGHAEASKLLHTLRTKHCKWMILSDEELQERKKVNVERHNAGEQVYKLRQKAGSC